MAAQNLNTWPLDSMLGPKAPATASTSFIVSAPSPGFKCET